MKKNLGGLDRIVRIIIAIVIGVLYFNNTIEGVLGIVLLVVAGVLLLTSFMSFCPLYSIVGLNSCKVKK